MNARTERLLWGGMHQSALDPFALVAEYGLIRQELAPDDRVDIAPALHQALETKWADLTQSRNQTAQTPSGKPMRHWSAAEQGFAHDLAAAYFSAFDMHQKICEGHWHFRTEHYQQLTLEDHLKALEADDFGLGDDAFAALELEDGLGFPIEWDVEKGDASRSGLPTTQAELAAGQKRDKLNAAFEETLGQEKAFVYKLNQLATGIITRNAMRELCTPGHEPCFSQPIDALKYIGTVIQQSRQCFEGCLRDQFLARKEALVHQTGLTESEVRSMIPPSEATSVHPQTIRRAPDPSGLSNSVIVDKDPAAHIAEIHTYPDTVVAEMNAAGTLRLHTLPAHENGPKTGK
jgi:hypothetical protein